MSGTNDRSDRLAAALRANLQRRKTQARARRAGEPAGGNGRNDPAATGAATPHATAPAAKSGENEPADGSAAPSVPDAKIVPDGEAG